MKNDIKKITKKEVEAGQAIYSKLTLAIYDFWVLLISNRFIWQCPSSEILTHYNQFISKNYLDIGVGTGFFLDSCNFPNPTPRLVLMDLNQNCLKYTSDRIKRYHPTSIKLDVLKSIQFEGERFDSISLNYLFHCLPGTMSSKEIVLKNILPLLKPGGVVFGSTILSEGVRTNFAARYLMNVYNKKGIFTNKNDSLLSLTEILKNNFSERKVKIIGCVALFWAKKSIK